MQKLLIKEKIIAAVLVTALAIPLASKSFFNLMIILGYGHLFTSLYFRYSKTGISKKDADQMGIAALLVGLLYYVLPPMLLYSTTVAFFSWHFWSDELHLLGTKKRTDRVCLAVVCALTQLLCFLPFMLPGIATVAYKAFVMWFLHMGLLTVWVLRGRSGKEAGVGDYYLGLLCIPSTLFFLFNYKNSMAAVSWYVIYHYISWYVHYALKYKSNKKKLDHYVKGVLLANTISIFLIIGWFFLPLQASIKTFVDWDYFAIVTIFHTLIMVRKSDKEFIG